MKALSLFAMNCLLTDLVFSSLFFNTSIVWSILALELIFEWLIRPSDYFQLITSDKAYAPSTARHINGFHLVFEAIALALFIPEFSCLSSKQCGRRVPFSGVDAALSAVLGPSRSRAAYGRLCIGLTSLRVIGLVRHWKTMWINRTFSENGVESKLLFMRIEDFLDDEPSQRGSLKNSKAKVSVWYKDIGTWEQVVCGNTLRAVFVFI